MRMGGVGVCDALWVVWGIDVGLSSAGSASDGALLNADGSGHRWVDGIGVGDGARGVVGGY